MANILSYEILRYRAVYSIFYGYDGGISPPFGQRLEYLRKAGKADEFRIARKFYCRQFAVCALRPEIADFFSHFIALV